MSRNWCCHVSLLILLILSGAATSSCGAPRRGVPQAEWANILLEANGEILASGKGVAEAYGFNGKANGFLMVGVASFNNQFVYRLVGSPYYSYTRSNDLVVMAFGDHDDVLISAELKKSKDNIFRGEWVSCLQGQPGERGEIQVQFQDMESATVLAIPQSMEIRKQ